MQQLLLTLTMLISEGVTLSDEQIMSIQRILLGAMDPTLVSHSAIMQPPASQTSPSSPELIYGLAGLASFFGVSIPTAARYREKYEPARIRFGGRKLVWDKSKLLELARNEK